MKFMRKRNIKINIFLDENEKKFLMRKQENLD